MKQSIIVRQDLKLPKGKAVSQGAHASVESVLRSDNDKVSKWRKEYHDSGFSYQSHGNKCRAPSNAVTNDGLTYNSQYGNTISPDDNV